MQCPNNLSLEIRFQKWDTHILAINVLYDLREIPFVKSYYSTAKLRHMVTLHSTRDSLMRDKYLGVCIAGREKTITVYYVFFFTFLGNQRPFNGKHYIFIQHESRNDLVTKS